MIVGRKLVSFEKLNGCLVQLQHDDFLQKAKALNVLTGCIYTLGKVCNFRDLFFLAHEKGFEWIFTLKDVL